MTTIQTSRVTELTAKRDEAAKAYYEGDPIMSDAQFDALLAELDALGVEQVPGHGYVPTTNTIVHEYPMQSLKKVHDLEDIRKWAKEIPAGERTFAVQPKYDGLALDLCYNKDGVFYQAATRGNHKKGENVTVAVQALIDLGRIPGTIKPSGSKTTVHVRGEILITHSDFAALNKESAAVGGRVYTSERNSAAGVLRKAEKTSLKHLTFVAYDTNDYDTDEVDTLDAWGFTTPKAHHYTVASTFADLEKALIAVEQERSTVYGLETDGAVIKWRASNQDREALGSTSTHPRWAVAYKYEDVAVSTIIRDVVWNHNRTGKLTPVAIFDGVTLEGNAFTTRATLANYAKFAEFGFRPGDSILVVRANGVIPFVVGLDATAERPDAAPFEAPKHYPAGRTDLPTRLSPTGKDILAHKDAPAPTAAIIENALVALDVKNIGPSFIDAAVENAGVTSVLDLFNLTHDDIVKMRNQFTAPGEKSTSATKAVADLKVAFQQPLWRWIAALGMPAVGKRISPYLEVRYGSLDNLAKATVEEVAKVEKFNGTVLPETVVRHSALIKGWADRLREEHNFEPKPEPKKEVKASRLGASFVGKTVVVTGTFPTMSRRDVEDWVREQGGKIGSSVSKSTDILLYGDKAGSKLAKAEQVGTVALVTAEQFEKELQAEAN